LRAVSALIDGFSRNPTSVLYSHLVTLHPNLVIAFYFNFHKKIFRFN